MITLQEIINRLNQLTLRYNLQWSDIKYDADKAIAKINAFMGTCYPKMSDHLVSPQSTYTVNVGGVQQEIFPEEYIHSVVIPFIAMEVLARDEEFTTIYNKYTMELEDGLFTMFQKEFNRVPMVFRQNPDQGVFFAADTAEGLIQRNQQNDLPVFKFRVHYHLNNPDIILSSFTATTFVEDTTAYLYDEVATVLGWSTDLLSFDGSRAYKFLGWTRDRAQVTTSYIEEGAQITMKSDVHLYANWGQISTLAITTTGVVSIKDTYKLSLTYLQIPDYVNGVAVKTIPADFASGATQLKTIALPTHLTTIEPYAFRNFNGESITLFEGAGVSPVTIKTNAFASTPNLHEITLPNNVMMINAGAFPVVNDKALTIYCRILQQNKPSGWADGWYSVTDETYNYVATVEWGYNG